MDNQLQRIPLTGVDGAMVCLKHVKASTKGKIVLNPFNQLTVGLAQESKHALEVRTVGWQTGNRLTKD